MHSVNRAEEDDMMLAEGACFGWFSSVNSKCQQSSCLQSLRCQQYTITLQQTNGLLDLKAPVQQVQQAEEASQPQEASSPEDIVQRALFDNTMNALVQGISHDEVHYDPTHTWATLKRNRLVVCFVIRNKRGIRIRLGNAKDTDRPETEIEMGTDMNEMKHAVASFLSKHKA